MRAQKGQHSKPATLARTVKIVALACLVQHVLTERSSCVVAAACSQKTADAMTVVQDRVIAAALSGATVRTAVPGVSRAGPPRLEPHTRTTHQICSHRLHQRHASAVASLAATKACATCFCTLRPQIAPTATAPLASSASGPKTLLSHHHLLHLSVHVHRRRRRLLLLYVLCAACSMERSTCG